MDYYGGGWQDILPSGGGPCIYQGVEMPFHGEVSMLPWECAVVSTGPTLAEIALRVRTMAVEAGVPALRIHEQITNEGGDDIELMWGQHLAFGAPFLSDHCWLDIPATTFLAHDPALGPTSRLRGGDRFAWPHGARDHAGRSLELRRVPAPSQAVADYGYLLDLRDGWYTLYNEELDLGVRVSWPSEVFSCVWLWQELHGSSGYPWHRRCYVMGVEPFTSHPGSGLTSAIKAGTARRLAAGDTLSAEFIVAFYERAAPPPP